MKESSILWTSLEATVITGGRNTQEWQATGLCINAQEVRPGDLFFATPDDNLEEIFRMGAAAAVVSAGAADQGWPLLRVQDVFEALHLLGRAARFRTHAQIIAVQGKSARRLIEGMIASVFDIHCGGRHLSMDLAGLPDTADFGVFGFSPLARPDIAVVMDCGNVDDSVFASMPSGGRALISSDHEKTIDIVARARASGIRNIFTFGHAADADARLIDILNASNGICARVRILEEDLELMLPPGQEFQPAMLAGALILKLSELSHDRIENVFSHSGIKDRLLSRNVAMVNSFFQRPLQAAFRVMNRIDLGHGRRTIVLDNVAGSQKLTVENRDLKIPKRIDNLDFIYASKGLSLFSNAESAIQSLKPKLRLEKIVAEVLAPGDFITFKGFTNGQGSITADILRGIPASAGNIVKVDHAL